MPEFITIRQAAEAAGLPLTTVDSWMRSKPLLAHYEDKHPYLSAAEFLKVYRKRYKAKMSGSRNTVRREMKPPEDVERVITKLKSPL